MNRRSDCRDLELHRAGRNPDQLGGFVRLPAQSGEADQAAGETMNKRIIIGAAIIVVALALAFTTFQDSLTAYVDYDQARKLDKNCQVMGDIDKEHVTYDVAAGVLRFPIQDESGDRMIVQFAGAIPGNFEQAKSVVAIGRYREGRFQAEQLLVKCPSKYQGLEEEGEQNPHETKIPHDGV
jgi:cytochrome c-type biogenesis protein CcmE